MPCMQPSSSMRANVHACGLGDRRLDADDVSCRLSVLLLYELYREDVVGALLPINALRNAALLAVTTPLASMVDVDLLLAARLAADMGDQAT